MAWTDERVEQLKLLWADGLSASQIAHQMGNVTRNAVIGKVHRLGFAGRATLAAPRPRVTIKSSVAREEEAKTLPRNFALGFIEGILSDRATINTISAGQCKWPLGDPTADDFHYCGQSADGGRGSYCPYHSQIAFQPAIDRREPTRPPTSQKE